MNRGPYRHLSARPAIALPSAFSGDQPRSAQAALKSANHIFKSAPQALKSAQSGLKSAQIRSLAQRSPMFSTFVSACWSIQSHFSPKKSLGRRNELQKSAKTVDLQNRGCLGSPETVL